MLGPSWDHLVTSLSHLGRFWGFVGTNLEQSWLILAQLASSWGSLGTLLEPSWNHLRVCWSILETILGSQISTCKIATFARRHFDDLVALLGPSYGVLGHRGVILGCVRPSLWAPWAPSWPPWERSWATLGSQFSTHRIASFARRPFVCSGAIICERVYVMYYKLKSKM